MSHPTWDSLEHFIDDHVEDGSKRRYIKRILISTNGIAAVKYINSVRKLLMRQYGHVKNIKFICMTTKEEIESNAEYLKLANKIVVVPSGDNKNNYANVEEIVSHAVEMKVDAVWPGWGHAAENPALPKKLAEHGISFIGPPSDVIFSLGDKIESTIIAQSVDIPTIEWSGSGLKLDVEACKRTGEVAVPNDVYKKAYVTTVQEGLDAIEKHKIGYPLIIKSSEGGGGKGIKKVANERDFKGAFHAVQTEVPTSPIFIMKCVENARHIEVHLVADRYGTVLPVYTRDCSIQRRREKIIEEAPATIAPDQTLAKMLLDAVAIAKLVGYESAGTVEYMYLPDENKYYFLVFHPRLQVEHPCTEMIAGINIPGIQLQIAMGLPLQRIVDTKAQHHSIAATIAYEDPENVRPSALWETS